MSVLDKLTQADRKKYWELYKDWCMRYTGNHKGSFEEFVKENIEKQKLYKGK